jgi:competence protein ComEC
LTVWPYLAKVKLGRVFSPLIAFLLIVVLVLPIPGSGRLTVTFLDVGQGDSIFVRSPSGRTCLIDGGGKQSQNGSDKVGEQIVIPFLQNMGLGDLDLVILTHPHDDHMQGLLTVLEELQVDQLVVAEKFLLSPELQPLLTITKKNQVNLVPVFQGQEIILDQGVSLKVLHPPRGETPEEEDVNNNSLVLKLCYQDMSFLLTGDGEMACLSSLCGYPDLTSGVLKLPHHGSKTGLLPDFYDQVAPKAVVISVGKNSFGHPSPEMLKYFQEQNIPIYRTDIKGAISFSTNGKELWVETFHP